ncbi:MAG: pyrroline-5-carboxylate reductase family protein [Candidatus Rokuibacteriota bacterium]
MASLHGKRIGVIGAGAIGGVVIDRLLAAAASRPADIIACEIRPERRQDIAARYGVTVHERPEAAGAADVVVLAVPPPAVADVLGELRGLLGGDRVVISFAGGVPLAFIEAAVPGVAVVRVNPNSPSVIGEGFNPVTYGQSATGARRALADAFLQVLGGHPEVEDGSMNVYTALTAVGPTYFLPVLDALVAAGQAAGLSRQAAVDAATATAIGTAHMVARRAETPEQLKLFTGLRPLDDAAVKRLVAEAVQAAVTRMEDVQRKITGGA